MTMEPKLPDDGLQTGNNETTATTTKKPIHPLPPLPPPPPRLHFDDGIRQTNHNVTYNSSLSTSEDIATISSLLMKTSIHEYYEIERLVSDIHTISRNIATSNTAASPGNCTGVDRTNSKIQSTTTVAATTTTRNPSTTDTVLMIRIAIQLPDELLHDAPDLCWEYESALQLLSVSKDVDDDNTHIQYYVFILGDTTYASCCPDIIAAQHINAHILIHYGHACLSHIHNHCNDTSTSTTTTKSVSNNIAKEQNQFPIILYSFGRKPISISRCVHDVLDELQNKNSNSNRTDQQQQQQQRILLLYEVQYAYAMDELCTTLQNVSKQMNGIQHLSIKMGKIPQLSSTTYHMQPTTMTTTTLTNKNCCSNGISNSNSNNDNHNCCKMNTDTETVPSSVTSNNTNVNQTTTYENSTTNDEMIKQYHRIMVGGLELPYPFSQSNTSNKNIDDDNEDEWKCSDDNTTSDYILLYIGDVRSRPFLNIVLRFLSDTSSAQSYNLSSIWTWSPSSDHRDNSKGTQNESLLCSNVLQNSIEFQRILQRRYYLIQKAKHCTTFGIIVAHMTKQIQQFISSIQRFLNQQCSNVSYYTFVVGKINPMKLTNFPEIDCFVLVACPEHTLLQNEREMYPIPIITPYELLVAFSNSSHNEWGSIPYSTYPHDYWTVQAVSEEQPMENDAIDSVTNQNDEDDDDAPYFSMVTGKYESRTNVNSTTATVVSDHTNKNDDNNDDTTTLVTKSDGTMIQYETNKSLSVASTFLKQRAYQGLVVMAPSEIQTLENNTSHHDNNREDNDDSNYNTIVQPAILGQTGIASKYGNR